MKYGIGLMLILLVGTGGCAKVAVIDSYCDLAAPIYLSEAIVAQIETNASEESNSC